jgi:hypothetical protein
VFADASKEELFWMFFEAMMVSSFIFKMKISLFRPWHISPGNIFNHGELVAWGLLLWNPSNPVMTTNGWFTLKIQFFFGIVIQNRVYYRSCQLLNPMTVQYIRSILLKVCPTYWFPNPGTGWRAILQEPPPNLDVNCSLLQIVRNPLLKSPLLLDKIIWHVGSC